MNNALSLPAGFDALQPYASQWAADSAAERAQKRLTSTETERTAFYNHTKDRLSAALELLDKKHPRQFDESETRLMNLLLSFAHVAIAVEVQGPDEEEHAKSRRHMTITRSIGDE